MRMSCFVLAAAVVSRCTVAFDISFGISGYDPALQQTLGAASPWFDIVGTCTRNQDIATATHISAGSTPCLVARGAGDWADMALTFCPRRIGADSDGIYVGTYSESSWNYIGTANGSWLQTVVSSSAPQDCYYLGTSGHGGSHMVFTISGDPYSEVWNLTSSAQTMNGVTIPAGEARKLYLPLRLAYWPAQSEDNDKYYLTDMEGSIIRHDIVNVNGNWRGCCVGWSGDFVIREHGYQDDANTNQLEILEITEHLLYADIKGENEYKIMYGEDGELVREGMQIVSTNIELMTWWDFTGSEWGVPQAKINGVVVCPSHDTSHIISYTVNNNRLVVNEMTGKGYFEFEMSQTPGNGASGGACTMRCWDASYGSSTSDYARTPAGHKAEIPAGLGVARFIFTVDIYKGTWKVEPL